MSKIYVGQIGVSIELDTQDDPEVLAESTTLSIKYRRPDKVEGEFPATQEGPVLKYVTTSSADLSIPGVWRLQAFSEGPGWKIRGETVEMTILAPFR